MNGSHMASTEQSPAGQTVAQGQQAHARHSRDDPGEWPSVGKDVPRTWTPSSDRRVPRTDRSVMFEPSLPSAIAQRTVRLAPATLATVEQAAIALARADAHGGPATVALLRSESAASSKVEHIEANQRYIARALAGLPTRQRAAKEVAANLDALQAALDAADRPVTPATIDDIHRRLLPEEDWSGEIRSEQNWIGGSDHSPRDARYIPPDPNRVAPLIEDLVAFMNREDIPVVAHAGIVHAQFEVIHPYADGNGRVGRALTHLVLRHRGVTTISIAPLSIAFLGHGDTYLDSLRVYERGDIDGYLMFFAECCRTAAAASVRLADTMMELVGEWQTIPAVSRTRSDSVLHRIVPDLPTYPVIDAAAVSQRYGVSRRAAGTALDTLEGAQILNRTTAARNHQIYEAHEVFAAIEDIERDVRAGRLSWSQ